LIGGGSYASYQNMETRLTVLNVADSLSLSGEFTYRAGFAVDASAAACTGVCVAGKCSIPLVPSDIRRTGEDIIR